MSGRNRGAWHACRVSGSRRLLHKTRGNAVNEILESLAASLGIAFAAACDNPAILKPLTL